METGNFFPPLRQRGLGPKGPGCAPLRVPGGARCDPRAAPAKAGRAPTGAGPFQHCGPRYQGRRRRAPSARCPLSPAAARPRPAGPGPVCAPRVPRTHRRGLLSAAAAPARPLPRLPPGQTAAAASRKRRQRAPSLPPRRFRKFLERGPAGCPVRAESAPCRRPSALRRGGGGASGGGGACGDGRGFVRGAGSGRSGVVLCFLCVFSLCVLFVLPLVPNPRWALPAPQNRARGAVQS